MKKELTTDINILKVPIGLLAKYDVEDLHRHLVKAIEELEKAKRLKQWLQGAIALKYKARIQNKRNYCGEDTGVISLEDRGFKVTSDVPKQVEWRQSVLSKIAGNILARGGKLSDYIEVHYHVPEAKYNNLPQVFKDMLLPARIIRHGNPVYKLTKLNDDKFEIVTLDQIMSEWGVSHE
ncbi:hypothetical protein [Rickettsia endosymbiont of Orchestes rusci]|uniref:hypothetical protein n=1 Tax=Rickettsia endosymbiont of Orchestes rusci TaxID=3066250 RepID=UPI00313B8BBD